MAALLKYLPATACANLRPEVQTPTGDRVIVTARGDLGRILNEQRGFIGHFFPASPNFDFLLNFICVQRGAATYSGSFFCCLRHAIEDAIEDYFAQIVTPPTRRDIIDGHPPLREIWGGAEQITQHQMLLGRVPEGLQNLLSEIYALGITIADIRESTLPLAHTHVYNPPNVLCFHTAEIISHLLTGRGNLNYFLAKPIVLEWREVIRGNGDLERTLFPNLSSSINGSASTIRLGDIIVFGHKEAHTVVVVNTPAGDITDGNLHEIIILSNANPHLPGGALDNSPASGLGIPQLWDWFDLVEFARHCHNRFYLSRGPRNERTAYLPLRVVRPR